MNVKFHQNRSGVEALNDVSNIQINNLPRDVDVVEVIDHHNSDVKVRSSGGLEFVEGKFVIVGEE